MKLYLKLFLSIGIPFGIGMGCIVGFRDGIYLGAVQGIIQGSVFGLIMALVLGTMHKIKTKNSGDDIGPYQSKTITVSSSLEALFDKCLSSLEQIKAQVISANKGEGVILAKTGMSWMSFGEIIKMGLVIDGENNIKVTISSRPKLKTTLVDFGKGHQNIFSLVSTIR